MNYIYPDKYGFFGKFGGQFVSNIIFNELNYLKEKYYFFLKKYKIYYYNLLISYSDRPTPLYYARNLSLRFGNCNIFFKREDLNYTGSHKINNVIGQLFLAKILNKKEVIAETGAGQHGYAVAAGCAKFNFVCKIFIGFRDYVKQMDNVNKILCLGSILIIIKGKNSTLNSAIDRAIKYWCDNINISYYLLGSVVGPHPYPLIVRNFQSIIGKECLSQKSVMGRNPDYIIACVGGGSNAIGIFYEYLVRKIKVKLIGIEAGGKNKFNNSSALTFGKVNILHGCKTYCVKSSYSISSGLNYPGVGPEHSFLKYKGLVNYKYVTDLNAIRAFNVCSRLEGIIPSLETSHALYYAFKLAIKYNKYKYIILVNFSGRGDKDISV